MIKYTKNSAYIYLLYSITLTQFVCVYPPKGSLVPGPFHRWQESVFVSVSDFCGLSFLGYGCTPKGMPLAACIMDLCHHLILIDT